MGSNDSERAKRLVGTSVVASVIFGFIVMIIGLCLSKFFLNITNCKDSLFDMANKYLTIYFLGMPILLLYNFCASILRAVGETFKPFIFLLIGGILNIALNVFFIVVFKKDVEGVAIATVTSQGVSALLSLIACFRSNGFNALRVKYVKLFKEEFIEILKLGIPTGLSRCMFSISNLVMTSAVNSFDEAFVAGHTIAHQFDQIIHDTCDAFAAATLTFVSQNLGAKNVKRIYKTILTSLAVVTIVGLVLGGSSVIFGKSLIGLMTNSPQVVSSGYVRLQVMGLFFFTTGTMNVFANTLRACGKPTYTLVGSIICTCVFRIVYVKTIFNAIRTPISLYAAYPISWILCTIVFAVLSFYFLKKIKNKFNEENSFSSVENTNNVKE